ncbi:coiled-coil domain-containing protein 47-like [Galendromus occidentalis]|uniref:PAT complex subunit CCDC47 n=1 Tax=Galendromus occidentalis TaxID=34638 RepID=A0AAJ6QS88_9ACAR|nr:coiled-coil domain-containing protein 47-like [Galendromus occidentalis]
MALEGTNQSAREGTDVRIVPPLAQFNDIVELLHILDQYSPEKPDSAEIEQGVTYLLEVCLYIADKVSRLELCKESKTKADKNRQEAEVIHLKYTHAQRQGKAQQRRKKRIRMERERILAADNSNKQKPPELKEKKYR